jgi:hypothetical protein
LVCADVFQGLFKSFSLPFTYKLFFASLKLLTNFENAYCNPPQISLLCDWSLFSSSNLSLAAVSKRRFRVLEAGYRKDFKNSKVISMEQKAKILSLIF